MAENCDVCTSPAPLHTEYCPRQSGAFPSMERFAIRIARPRFPDMWITAGNSYPPPVAPYYGIDAAREAAARMQLMSDTGRTDPATFTVHPYPFPSVRAA